MVQGTQWPSFIIQGIILGSDIYFISHANLINIWIILSILCILTVFALQTTSQRFIYLFSVSYGNKTTYWDTHILRVGIILSASFLFIALQQKYYLLSSCWFIPAGIFFIFILPLIFNFCLNEKIESKLKNKYDHKMKIEIQDAEGNKRGVMSISNNKLIWQPETEKHEISIDELISLIEKR